ncbi:hypothetical protein JT359_07550 [Candidatus Poribacteria bacterium]|nr:hypothetical protein [Candidatus Poribacteria bacterium]
MSTNIRRFNLSVILILNSVLILFYSITFAQNEIHDNIDKDSNIIINSALYLDGNNSYVEIPDSNLLKRINQHITITAWIKPIAFPNRYTSIIYKGDKGTPENSNISFLIFLRNDGAIQFSSSLKGERNKYVFSQSNAVSLNKWTHISGVIDIENNIIELYIDGIKSNAVVYNLDSENQESKLPLQIGNAQEANRETHSPFVGLIDDVSIWNKALLSNDIQNYMENSLHGTEDGLAAYWNFDQSDMSKITDTSDNNDGILKGNAKTIEYTQPEPFEANPDQIKKIIKIYIQKIENEPDIFEYYRILGQALLKSGRISDAKSLYLQALDADLTLYESENILLDLSSIYTFQDEEKRLIEILNDLQPSMDNSLVLYKLLGDTHSKLGNDKKAENAYKVWYKNERKRIDLINQASEYNRIAELLLEIELLPEEALDCAILAYNNGNDSKYIITLGHAFLVNERFGDTLHLIETNIESIGLPFMERRWFERIVKTSKNIKNKETYIEMLKSIIDLMPNYSSPYYHATLALADFYQENGMKDKAKIEINKTGFITEDSWIVLAPFDNRNDLGCKKSFINEKLTKFNSDEVYEGKYEKIQWRNGKDEIFNGYVSFGVGENWAVGYAFTTVISPIDQAVQFRFDSDDQGKVWLNGKPVFEHTETFTAEIDDYKFPVFLNAGKNSILVKVCERDGGWGFYFRITDKMGNPIPDLIIEPTR